MTTGMVSDIREFTLHDGPGIRTTVFLKGCPLRCCWCHNPESLSPELQEIRAGGLRRIVGTRYEAAELAGLLNRQAAVLKANSGGITFSGGEPLFQAQFVAEVIDRLDDVHVLLDTCGFAAETEFRLLATKCQLVYYDIKLIDAEAHRRYVGVDNAIILSNLACLGDLGVPFVVRVPLIPGVTDTQTNLSAIALAVRGIPGLVRVDLLPYNRAAGGKYAALGMTFHPGFDERAEVNADPEPFVAAGIEVRIAGATGS
jgi:pyruvate formate lyase activating enzyme